MLPSSEGEMGVGADSRAAVCVRVGGWEVGASTPLLSLGGDRWTVKGR